MEPKVDQLLWILFCQPFTSGCSKPFFRIIICHWRPICHLLKLAIVAPVFGNIEPWILSDTFCSFEIGAPVLSLPAVLRSAFPRFHQNYFIPLPALQASASSHRSFNHPMLNSKGAVLQRVRSFPGISLRLVPCSPVELKIFCVWNCIALVYH